MRYFETAFQLKMPAWRLSEHFPQSGFMNFPQEKATKSALALPERNSMLAMIRLLVFSSSLLQVLSVVLCLLIMAVHDVWPLSQELPSMDALPAARLWASLNGSDLLTVILDVSPLSLHTMAPICAVMFQRHLRLKTPNPASSSVFSTEASGVHRNSGSYSQLFSLSEPMWSFCH